MEDIARGEGTTNEEEVARWRRSWGLQFLSAYNSKWDGGSDRPNTRSKSLSLYSKRDDVASNSIISHFSLVNSGGDIGVNNEGGDIGKLRYCNRMEVL